VSTEHEQKTTVSLSAEVVVSDLKHPLAAETDDPPLSAIEKYV
jgi:hypothetical protein